MKKLLLFVLFLAGLCAVSAAPNPFFKAALTSTSTLVKSSPAFLWSYNVSNPNSSAVFIQVFDAATAASVTPGTTAPLFVLSVPASGTLDGSFPKPPAFANGIVIFASTTSTGSGAPTAAIPITLLYE